MYRFKFADGCLDALRSKLLADLSKESFAVLLGRRSSLAPEIVRIVGVRYPTAEEIIDSSRTRVSPAKSYVHNVLAEVAERLDVDVLIDVHTHPFSERNVRFSTVDDADEISFSRFLEEHFPQHLYGSIVLSESDYDARVWLAGKRAPKLLTALIVTQRSREQIPRTGAGGALKPVGGSAVYDRVSRVIGLPALRTILNDQCVLIAGLGGLGSVMAESLAQMGFSDFVLVDPDYVEFSNLSRLAGATYRDAIRRSSKVDIARRRIRGINPKAKVKALRCSIESFKIIDQAKLASWIIVATDNHSSRLQAQRLAHELFIPLIAAGVNITVSEGEVTDESGEIVLCLNGAEICLLCTGRVNFAKVAQESHPSQAIRDGIVERGYVSGAKIEEPAVRTLNSIVAALAVDTLVDQYTGRRDRDLIQVYDATKSPVICSGSDTIPPGRGCYACSISEPFLSEI